MKKAILGVVLIISFFLLVFSVSSNKKSGDYFSEDETQLKEVEEEEFNGRQEWFLNQRAFPFKKIPRGAREEARKYVLEKMRPAQKSKIHPNLRGVSWQAFGPDSIPNGQLFPNGTRGAVSGRVTSAAIDPTNSNIIYIGSAQGGVWKTTDGGTSWVPLTDDQPSLAIGSIVIDPTNSNIIYAGTGEGNGALDSYFGAGILKSTNGGQTWQQQATSLLRGLSIADMVINPLDPSTLYAATTLGGSSVNGGFLPSAPTTGVYKGILGGLAWTRLANSPTNVQDIQLDPTNPDIIYAAQNRGGIFRSTDAGTTWSLVGGTGFPAATQFRRIAFAIAPSNNQIIYAALENAVTRDLFGILRTTDGGATWTTLTNPPLSDFNNICQCFYDNVISVSPSDPNTVFYGGVAFYRSTNGGTSWTDISKVGLMHPDFHAIAFDPANSSRLVTGNDGGVWISSDGGGTWTNINANLSITQFQYIAARPNNNIFVIGGTQDNGTIIRTNANTWINSALGDGGAVLTDPSNLTTLYHAFTRVSFQRSDDNGSTWTNKTNGLTTNDRTLFYSPIAIDQSNPNTIYFGTFRLNRSTNRGDNWAPITGDLTNGGATSAISAIAVAPMSSQTIYVGTSDGNVQVSTDGGTTFNLRTSGLPVRYITRIAVSWNNAQIAYLTVSGFGSGHVFRTDNGGVTWTDISSNLPDIPANALVTDSSSPNTLFIGTDIGVFVTHDGGATWYEIYSGMPNTAVFDLQIHQFSSSLYAATHGRGVFRLNQNSSLPTITTFSPMAGSPLQTVTINGTGLLSISAVRFGGVNASFSITSGSQITATVPLGASTGPITITTPNGTATSTDHFFVGFAGSGPQISSFTPSGTIGQSITINGTNFIGATAVRFNGTSALFTVNSLNRITTVVPTGATTGPISVTTPNGTRSTTSNFTVN